MNSVRSALFGFILVLLAALISALPGTPADGPVKAPNILLITVDTLRADHLSSYGYHLKTTPNIDRLASEGVRFDKVYCTIPLTGPSHFSMFTSRYPQEHGARINGVAVPDNSKWLALPQILRKFGYHNAAFVSAWPLTARLTRLNRWFDHYDEDLTRSYRVFTSMRFAEDVTPRVVKWLKETPKQEPFFIWAHYFDPHEPYTLHDKFAAPQRIAAAPGEIANYDAQMQDRIRRYDSEVGYTDYYIGQVLDELDRLKLRDNTIVVFSADHGESLGEQGYVGHGRRLSEATVRVPLIFRYPGKLKAGQVIEEDVSLLDLTPTLLGLTVAQHMTQEQRALMSFAGMSLAPAMTTGTGLPRRPIRYLTFTGKKAFAPRWLSWMWVPTENRLPLFLGMTEGARKLIWSPRTTELTVYDLDDDGFELHPEIYAKNDGVYERETPALQRWFDATNLEDAETTLSDRDTEILKSLGYVH